MRKVYIDRLADRSVQTKGTLVAGEFSCKTLELPWKNNEKSVSCIPDGEYICKWTYSPAFDRYLYEVKDVPNRSGIRIHPANYIKQLRGCIALGAAHKDLDFDKIDDVTHSGQTCWDFMQKMGKEDFLLIIKTKTNEHNNQLSTL